MLRPGGFPEYSPAEQKIFDRFMDILRQHFEQRNYAHIHTPAVEPVDVLSRGGDIFDKQVFGLYGLAQGTDDVKDYALHFDLTIPFARYTIDHLNDIVFPFKRYQMQPVRRGERQKRGRYKEFWQFDIDTIWRDATDVGVWYDAECVIVMARALQDVFTSMHVDQTIIVKLSHIRIIQSILASRNTDETQNKQVFKILDDRYKRTTEANMTMLHETLTSDQTAYIYDIIVSQDLSKLSQYDGYADMKQIADYLTAMNIQREFALPIVRGHAYYTGMVAEFFVAEDMSLGAIAGGGRYEKLTDFIDRKHSFSGVGLSVSNRIMEFLLDAQKANPTSTVLDSYFFIHFPETLPDILALMNTYIVDGKAIELCPTPMKLGKQFELADKKGCRYAVILGSGEKEKGLYMIKDLVTGESRQVSLTI